MDFKTEQQVWERVSGQASASLRSMELRCRESAEVLHLCAGAAPVQLRDALRHLSKKAYANAITIRGMRVMDGEAVESDVEKPTQTKVPLRRGLAQCFRRSQQARADYLAYQGEYAPIFQLLLREEEEIMQELLSLIGREK